MKNLLFLFVVLLSFQNYSQTFNLTELKGKELHNSIRLNYILVHQPFEQVNYELAPTLGFIGLNYNIPLNDWLYTGAGFHTAITGDQGGLFTLGVNLGVNTPIYKNLYFDANVHFGGGGGFRSLVNGGGMIYPNAGLQYKKNGYSFGVQYGYVNFFTGIQKNDNISFFVEIPSLLRLSSYKDAQKTFILNDNSIDEFWAKPAVKSVQQITFDYFFPIGMSRADITTNPQYKPLTETLSIIGFEYQRYLTSNTFIYAHVDTMYSGLVSGFMDLFFGIGKNFIETKNVNFFAKMGIGAAGGRIYPEGGLTMYPSAGFDVHLNDKLGISAHGGYHRAIGGTFEAYTAGVSLKYYGLTGGLKDPFSKESASKIKTHGVGVGVQNQTYFKMAKDDNTTIDLEMIALKLFYDLNKRFYLVGETSFAYEGKSGGYAHGIFGLGVRSNPFLSGKISTFIELMGGVAGGAGVDTGEGVLVRPTIGVNYHLSDSFSFNIAAGQTRTPYGNVNSTNLNIGFTYNLSILNTKK
ncbi:hypothetical protein SAMN05216503_2039 [Polaribacter sp. KT25b]|uniref:hypothetical protein n=1 Tax=Polaribacter sp. KT25b TaxID=1855336 RepID=UPI00087A9099|nr:hypothetical protein [Polaribacter sp. KT25b]SDS12112.1 hypothetical protein SAMN05216503_2039 [Polaribacter sp. KT25b]